MLLVQISISIISYGSSDDAKLGLRPAALMMVTVNSTALTRVASLTRIKDEKLQPSL